MRTDPLDHARGEVLLDPLDRAWEDHVQTPRLELQPIGTLVGPLPLALHILPGAHQGSTADHRHQLPMSAGLHPQDAKPRLRTMEGHTLGGAGKMVMSGEWGVHFSRPGGGGSNDTMEWAYPERQRR